MESWIKTRLMKKISLSIVLTSVFMINLSSFEARAQMSGPIESLAEGSCWVERGYPAKVASFNQSSAFSIEEETIMGGLFQLSEQLENDSQLRVGREPLFDASFHLHCSGHGAYLVLNIEVESTGHDKQRVCAWFEVDHKGAKLAEWGISERKEGFCYGQSPGEIAVGVSSEEEMQRIMGQLYAMPTWSQKIDSYETMSFGLGIIYLKNGYWGQEQNLIEQLNELKKFRFVEAQQIFWPVGDFIELFAH